MKKLFIAWQDAETREWTPVGCLFKEDDKYVFVYTEGARKVHGFLGFGRMNDLDKRYVSETLFPLFKNRMLAKGRPEYKNFLEWLGLSEFDYNDVEELARTGGVRATDNLELFPCPEPSDDGKYRVSFFCRGLKHLHPENIERSKELHHGEKLYLTQDIQNPYDSTALLLRSDQPITLVGYAPRYYSAEFTNLAKLLGPEKIEITVDAVNPTAPMQFRVRCLLVCDWPSGFLSCDCNEYRLLA